MTGTPASAGGPRRRLAMVLAISAVVVVAAALALALMWRERTAVAEWLLALALPRLGLADARAEVEEVGLRHAVLRNVRVDAAGELTARRVAVTYGWRMLLSGRVGTVEIDGFQAALAVGADGVTLAGLPAAPGREPSPDGALPPTLPFDRLELREATILVDTDAGPVTIELDSGVTVEARDRLRASMTAAARHEAGSGRLSIDDAAIDFTRDGIAVGLRFVGSGAALDGEGRIAGRLDLAIAPDAGTLDGRFAVDDAAFAMPDLAVSGLGGTLGIETGPGEPPLLVVDLAVATATFRETALAPARLSGRVSPERIDLTAEAETAAGPVSITLAPMDETAMGPHRFSLAAALDVRTTADRLASGLVEGGTVILDLDGRIPFPLAPTIDPTRIIEDAAIRGRVDVDIAGLDLPGLGSTRQVRSALALEGEAGSLTVQAIEDMTVTGLRIAEVPEALPPDIRTMLAEAIQVELAPGFRAEMGVEGNLVSVEATGLAHLGARNADLSVSGTAALQAADDRMLITAPSVNVTVRRLEAQGLALSGSVEMTDLTTDGIETRTGIGADLRFAGRPVPDIRHVAGTLALTSDIYVGPDHIELRPQVGARLGIEALRADGGRLLRPTALVLRSVGDVVRLDPATGSMSGSLRLRPFTVMAIADDIGDVAVAAQSVRLDGDGRSVRIRLGEGFVEAPEVGIQLDGVDADVRLAGARLAAADIAIDSIEHLAEPPAVVPLRMTLRATESRGIVTFGAVLQDRPRRIRIEGTGTHNLATGRGSVDVRTPTPILLLPNVLQPQQLFPAAYGIVTEANGQIDLRARAAWGSGPIESSARIGVDLEKLATRAIRVTGLVTDIALADLARPRTAGQQRVSIDKLDIGVPLENGVLVFEMPSPDQLIIELEQFHLFGGRLRTAPIAVNPADPTFEAELVVENVDVEQMLAFADYGDLEATGIVRGRIPVSFADGRVSIRDGLLESIDDGGIIRYRAPGVGEALQVATEPTTLLVNVLRNFLYDYISMEIDELEDGTMRLGLTLKGRSPETAPGAPFSYADLPVELYITITGPIRELLNRELDILDVQGQIERALGGAPP